MAEIGRELQLTIQAAFREAVSRRHAYVTVEHLLFALLHDERGTEVLRHAAPTSPALKRALQRFFDEDVEQLDDPKDADAPDARLPSRDAAHAAARGERREGGDRGGRPARRDLPGARLARRRAVARAGRHRDSTCSSYISHGVSKLGAAPGDPGYREPETPAGGIDGDEAGVPGDPLAAFATQPDRARDRAGKLDPLVGRETEIERADPHPRAAPQEQPDLRRRDRRREDRDRRGARAAHRRRATCPTTCAAPRCSRSISARCSPARATAATSRRASRRWSTRSSSARSRSSSSTRSTPSSAPARRRAARSTRRTC